MTLFESDQLTGRQLTGTHDFFLANPNLDVGTFGLANKVSSWKCDCLVRLNVEATCPQSNDEIDIEGEYVAIGTFEGRPIYEKTIADSNGSWWFIRFDSTTDRWIFDSMDERVTEGTYIAYSPVVSIEYAGECELKIWPIFW